MLKRWLQRERVHAIHKRDLKSVLRDIGLLDDLQGGSLSCAVCAKPITLDTLQCLFMEEDQVKLCCDNGKCYQKILSKREMHSE